MNPRRNVFAISGILLLMVGITFGCSPRSTPAPTREPTQTPTATATREKPTHTPTVVVIVEAPKDTPTITATATPTRTPTRAIITQEPTAPPTEAPDEGISPTYDIYVGLVLTGQACGGYTNSGGFSRFSFDSAFHNVRFVAPSAGVAGLPTGGFYGGGMMPIPLLAIRGDGEVSTYEFCPAYDGDKERTCQISEGPKPFEPRLNVVPEGDALPVEPLVPDASELDRGPAILLYYSIGSATGGGPIMLWDCEGFHLGALGGAMEQMGIYFYLPWRRAMQGEDHTIEYTQEDWRGHGIWTLRLVPAGHD